jgi:hypothetical protein
MDVQESREGRTPGATAAVEPTGMYLRRVLQSRPGCFPSPLQLGFNDNRETRCRFGLQASTKLVRVSVVVAATTGDDPEQTRHVPDRKTNLRRY